MSAKQDKKNVKRDTKKLEKAELRQAMPNLSNKQLKQLKFNQRFLFPVGPGSVIGGILGQNGTAAPRAPRPVAAPMPMPPKPRPPIAPPYMPPDQSTTIAPTLGPVHTKTEARLARHGSKNTPSQQKGHLSAQLRAKLAALCRNFPDEMAPVPGPINANGLAPEVSARCSKLKRAITLTRNGASADANYYAIMILTPGPTAHIVRYFPDASDPAKFALASVVVENDPLVASLSASIKTMSPLGMCIRITDTSALVNIGGTIITGNLPYSTLQGNPTFADLMALDNVHVAPVSTDPICMRWTPWVPEDVTAVSPGSGAGGTTTCLFMAIQSTVVQNFNLELTTCWTLLPTPVGADILGSTHQPVDDGFFQDAINTISSPSGPMIEKEDEQESMFVRAAKSLGKDALKWVTDMVVPSFMGDFASSLPLLGNAKAEMALRAVAALQTFDPQKEVGWPPEFLEAFNVMMRYRLHLTPEKLVFQRIADKKTWIISAVSARDEFDVLHCSRDVRVVTPDETKNEAAMTNLAVSLPVPPPTHLGPAPARRKFCEGCAKPVGNCAVDCPNTFVEVHAC